MLRTQRVLVAGWYGNRNVGDEAILGGIKVATRPFAGIHLTALSDNPRHTAQTVGLSATRRSLPIRGSKLFVEVAAAFRNDGYVLGGGGLLKDMGRRPGNCHAWLQPMRAAQILRKWTMTYGLGVELIKFEASRRIIRETLDRCALVTVRDPASKRLLENIGVRARIIVTADPAILLESDSGDIAPRPRPRIVVNIRHWFTTTYPFDKPTFVEGLHRALARALDRIIADTNASVTFLPFRDAPWEPFDDDRSACGRVAALMRRQEAAAIVPVPSPLEAVRIYADADFSIGMRLHSMILSAAAGTPFAALAYMPKVEGFVDHAGVRDAVAAVEGNTEEEIERAVLRVFEERSGVRDRLRQTVPLMRELALLNGAMLSCVAQSDGPGLDTQLSAAANARRRLEAACDA